MIGLSIVITVFNGQVSLPGLYVKLQGILPLIKNELGRGKDSASLREVEIIFVNDGSTDKSLELMRSFALADSNYRYISLSRSFGHPAAVSAGIFYARGKAVVVMDADMQDPPEFIQDMIKKWQEGYDVVYAVRKKIKSPAPISILYKFYHWINCKIADFPIQIDAGDFSLMDRKVINAINLLPEKERHVRGLSSWVGFRQIQIPYVWQRPKGPKIKYSLAFLVKFVFHGILSTSVKPLFLSGVFCGLSVLIILGIIMFSFASKTMMPEMAMPKGWTSLMILISLLSSLQFISMWFLSLYMARIHKEVVSRPAYIVAEDSLNKQTQ